MFISFFKVVISVRYLVIFRKQATLQVTLAVIFLLCTVDLMEKTQKWEMSFSCRNRL